ncbi:hypothetical protein [Enterovirga aerilata]|uniref:Uncharacterized protein n=1 Tax=Enterovirga aerilata TaxID=2730920 RepID=A0A849I999_9HYPH|nr:hypothetical protein [Enterovirga sp. DB1703]NNM73968.1 hypothetical protein [Enterovirga sp. DB1703]
MAEGSGEDARRFDEVDSTGPNARPRHDTISQTGPGIPDDTGAAVEVGPEEEKRIADSIRNLPGSGKGA